MNGPSTSPRPFPWHEEHAAQDLLGRFGFSVRSEVDDLRFCADSAEAYLDTEWTSHPLALARLSTVRGHQDVVDRLRHDLIELLSGANEVEKAFQVTSRYVIMNAQRAEE